MVFCYLCLRFVLFSSLGVLLVNSVAYIMVVEERVFYYNFECLVVGYSCFFYWLILFECFCVGLMLLHLWCVDLLTVGVALLFSLICIVNGVVIC